MPAHLLLKELVHIITTGFKRPFAAKGAGTYNNHWVLKG
jgi:hypothetical protein